SLLDRIAIGLSGLCLLHCMAGFVLLAGEEISWGQRLLGFVTPAAIGAVNTQAEFNFHNTHGVPVAEIFLLLSLYGVLSGFFAQRYARILAWAGNWSLFVVPRRFAVYFLPQILYYFACGPQVCPLFGLAQEAWRYQEIIELLFALGCFLSLFFRLRQVWQNKGRG
ncbi:MAG: hypothetical protein K2Q01_02855, partial [Rickettsiales bacterium]|nr:hypothetical protein [Rickettsiales bacterium]